MGAMSAVDIFGNRKNKESNRAHCTGNSSHRDSNIFESTDDDRFWCFHVFLGTNA